MIKAKVQLFDDYSGKDIGAQKIVSPEACTIYCFPDEGAMAEFEFKVRAKDPEILSVKLSKKNNFIHDNM